MMFIVLRTDYYFMEYFSWSIRFFPPATSDGDVNVSFFITREFFRVIFIWQVSVLVNGLEYKHDLFSLKKKIVRKKCIRSRKRHGAGAVLNSVWFARGCGWMV